VQEQQVERVVARLRAGNVMAHVYSGGVYEFGVRVVLPDGREAIWDADGAAGLEATVLRDGQLVGMVPTIDDSAGWDDDQVVAAIAEADYGEG
jgi:hypothetical protein